MAQAPSNAHPIERPHVIATLLAESDTEAILRRQDGTRLCALPCKLPIPYEAGYYVDVERNGTTRRVEVPGDLGPDQSRMTAIVERKEGHPGAAISLALGGGGMLILGGLLV